MAGYIKREAAFDAITDLAGKAPTRSAYESVWKSARVLKSIPAADVAPVVHGHWVVRFDGPYKRRRCYCSHCGKHNGVGGIAQNQEKPYCPNCGAKMDGKEKLHADDHD